MKSISIPLATSEIAAIWSGYLSDSMSNCVLRHFLSTVEDREIASMIEYALSLTEEHLRYKNKLLADESFPIPDAFHENDVDLAAPRLFSDSLMLLYLRQIGISGLNAYALAVGTSAREDIRSFFSHNVETAKELLNRSTDLMLEKGLFQRPPQIPYPDQTETVKKEGWLNGFWGDRRMLNAAEITHLWMNIYTNSVGKALMTGFRQTSKDRDIAQYCRRAVDISEKHIRVFRSLLENDGLPAPMTYDADITDSTHAPFSDKLMLFHTVGLSALGIGNYGLSLAASPRRDIAATYARLSAEVGMFAEDGAELLIRHGWLEKVPEAIEREALAGKA